MSSGPIAREREAHTSPPISTPDKHRVCMRDPRHDRSYCGRTSSKAPLVQSWHLAVCADCAAAARADGRGPA